MKITSPLFIDNGMLPDDCTCKGAGVNPPLSFSDIPPGTLSLALVVNDPDAPSGDFVHWIVWNIDPEVGDSAAGAVPSGGVVGKNTTGERVYTPACPPTGIHRYFFNVYALDVKLAMPETADRAALQTAIEGHVLAHAALMGRYVQP